MISEYNITEALAEKIVAYLNARRDNKEESFLKSKIQKNKQGKVTNGAIIERLSAQISKHVLSSEAKKLVEAVKKSKKTKEQSSLEFQQQKFNQLLNLIDEDILDIDLIELKKEYAEFVLKNTKEHEPIIWLNQWTPKAIDISFATHVGKLTHSSSKSSSILDITKDKNDKYLTTNRLREIAIDTASSNAASLPIAEVLSLAEKDVSLFDLLKQGDASAFRLFTSDSSLIENWIHNLKNAFDVEKKNSYFLNKQIYFPVTQNEYHLLLPLTSSSLAHEIHVEQKKRWEEPIKQLKNKKYSDIAVVRYPNTAYLHITGSNHSNASSLNGKRGGRLLLMAALPPKWHTQPHSYNDKESIFGKLLANELRDEILELSSYLLVLKTKTLSVSQPQRNAAILNKLRAINSQLFNYLDSINDAEKNEGWSLSSKLDIEYQLLFEPWRNDDAAVACKLHNDWQAKISQEFGRWLNQQLNKNKKLQLTPVQAALWAACFLIDLKNFIVVKEVQL